MNYCLKLFFLYEGYIYGVQMSYRLNTYGRHIDLILLLIPCSYTTDSLKTIDILLSMVYNGKYSHIFGMQCPSRNFR